MALSHQKFLGPFLVVFFMGACGHYGNNGDNLPNPPAPSRQLTFTTGMDASLVIGQSNFVSSTVNAGVGSTNAVGLNIPDGAASDGTKLVVVDRGNHRVLLYNTMPTTNGPTPDVVLGQSDFTSGTSGGCTATGLTSPRSASLMGTQLAISDTERNRILLWNTFPTANLTAADIALGQINMTTCTSNQGVPATPAANTLRTNFSATGWFTSTQFFVADTGNNRVLIYNPPYATNMSASVVIGQTAMNTRTTGTTASTLNNLDNTWSDGTRVCIADRTNHRVLIYNSIPTTNGQSADVVLGQLNFTSGSANQGGTATASTLNQPHACLYYGGKFFVADKENHRVLIWNSLPTSNAQAADVVLGQTNFTSSSANMGGTAAANTLNTPTFLAYDGSRLIVADQQNNRVLFFGTMQ